MNGLGQKKRVDREASELRNEITLHKACLTETQSRRAQWETIRATILSRIRSRLGGSICIWKDAIPGNSCIVSFRRS